MKYTTEEIDLLKLYYVEQNRPVEEVAELLNRTSSSVRAKLVSLKLYQSPGYRSKDGNPPIKKAELVAQLANELNVPLELADSLEKVSKFMLQKILARLKSEQK